LVACALGRKEKAMGLEMLMIVFAVVLLACGVFATALES
jgi:hypothetical protein